MKERKKKSVKDLVESIEPVKGSKDNEYTLRVSLKKQVQKESLSKLLQNPGITKSLSFPLIFEFPTVTNTGRVSKVEILTSDPQKILNTFKDNNLISDETHETTLLCIKAEDLLQCLNDDLERMKERYLRLAGKPLIFDEEGNVIETPQPRTQPIPSPQGFWKTEGKKEKSGETSPKDPPLPSSQQS